MPNMQSTEPDSKGAGPSIQTASAMRAEAVTVGGTSDAAATGWTPATADSPDELWRELLSRVCDGPEGFDGLSEDEKLFFVVRDLSVQVYNGGFHQYFYNSSGNHFEYAVHGLDWLREAAPMNLLILAADTAFETMGVSSDKHVRRKLLDELSDERVDKLYILSTIFDGLDEGLMERLNNFAFDAGLVNNS